MPEQFEIKEGMVLGLLKMDEFSGADVICSRLLKIAREEIAEDLIKNLFIFSSHR